MTEEQDAGLKELDLLVAANKEEEIWHRVEENTKKIINELEKSLEDLPEQIKVNREILEFAKSKGPKSVNDNAAG